MKDSFDRRMVGAAVVRAANLRFRIHSLETAAKALVHAYDTSYPDMIGEEIDELRRVLDLPSEGEL